MGVPVSNCSALAYYQSPRLAGHNIAPKLHQNRIKYLLQHRPDERP